MGAAAACWSTGGVVGQGAEVLQPGSEHERLRTWAPMWAPSAHKIVARAAPISGSVGGSDQDTLYGGVRVPSGSDVELQVVANILGQCLDELVEETRLGAMSPGHDMNRPRVSGGGVLEGRNAHAQAMGLSLDLVE